MTDDPRPQGDNPEAEDSNIHSDEVKEQHTSHWDWDYLPREELEKAVEEAEEEKEKRDKGEAE